MRVLIVSPHFPPMNAPDMHRVRLLLPFLGENGWQAEVLCLAPEMCWFPLDPWMTTTVSPSVAVHVAVGLGRNWGRVPGLGSGGIRGLRALARLGNRLLKETRFDLVYFSTTAFEVHVLGPYWKRRFGTPFAMDYQDPWVTDYYKQRPHLVPPGGRLRYTIADRIHRVLESGVVGECGGVTAVSASYLDDLRARYGEKVSNVSLVAGFPACASDVESIAGAQRCSMEERPVLRWVYGGACGPYMERSLRGFFRALREYGSTELREKLQIEFFGTSYAHGGKSLKMAEGLAREYGLSECVKESPERLPYSETIGRLLAADALIVPGSDDPGYSASKIYPYVLARRPMLTVFHESSPVVAFLADVGGAVGVTFGGQTSEEELARLIGERWFTAKGYKTPAAYHPERMLPYADRVHAQRICDFFARVVANARGVSDAGS